MTTTPQHITQLSVNNVLRISVAQVTPSGEVIIVGGQNGSGKTSLLDSIQMAICGERTIPQKPVKDGEPKGSIEVTLDDLIIRRTFTEAGGTSLTVSSRDGAKLNTPQKILDSLVGKITFDPMEFMRMKPAQQIELLKKLTGLDFTQLDASRASLYQRRTDTNRDLASARADLATKTYVEGLPETEVNAAELSQKYAEGVRLNAAREALWQRHLATDQRALAAGNEVARIETMLKQAKNAHARASAEVMESRKTFNATPFVDVAPISAQVTDISATNQKIRANQDYVRARDAAASLETEVQALTASIDEHDAVKRKSIADAALPVPNLSFDETGVTLNGKPFEQASDAEKIRTSVAMGLALNPTLRVVLIRDGSLLDSKSLAIIQEMAATNNAQIWVERVSDDGKGCQVVMVDGTAYQQAPAQ